MFTLLDDGLAYVKDGDQVMSDPGGAEPAWPPSPPSSRTPSSRPPRSAPASASSSSRTLSPGLVASLASRREEPGVGDHPVVGPHRPALDVPGPRSTSKVSAMRKPARSSASRSSAVWVIVGR